MRQVLESIMEKQLASGEEFGEKLALKLHVYQELIGFIDYYGDDGGQGRSMLEMKKMYNMRIDKHKSECITEKTTHSTE